MGVTTSLTNVNGDKYNNNPLYTAWYVATNLLNNAFPRAGLDENIRFTQFACDYSKAWDVSPTKASPTRKLSDLFWHSLSWDRIQKELGQVNILDIGCGSGNYSQRLFNYLPENATYSGIDVYTNKNWKEIENNRIQIEQYDGENISKFLEGKNFIMSQSSVEHWEKDLHLFQQLAAYTEKCNYPVLQIHLVPAPICLWLYGLHGFRQYTPRTLSKVTKLFSSYSDVQVMAMGGGKCNDLHLNYIRRPTRKLKVDFRDTKLSEYDSELKKAFDHDQKNPGNSPSFYALIIHSKVQERIFI